MKMKVKMTCILKSGQVIKDSFPVKKKDTQTLNVIESIRDSVEDQFAHPSKYKENAGCVTFGHSTIRISEIAAITFKY
jgi:autonomous glycyl radical cofactor GrcA